MDVGERAEVQPERLPALTSLRFLAALIVVVYHFGGGILRLSPDWIRYFFLSGGPPVRFFFILSGFVLAHVYRNSDLGDRATKTKFWRARVARIAPLYYSALFLGLVNLPTKLNELNYSPLFVLLSVVAKVLFLHSFVPAVVIDPWWAIPTWTLSVEAAFYVLFPFAFPFLSRLKGVALFVWATLSLLIAGFPAELARELTGVSLGQRIWYLNGFMYPSFFILGVLVSNIMSEHREAIRTNSSWLLTIGLCGAIIGMNKAWKLSLSYPVHALGCSCIILGVPDLKGRISRGLSSGPAVSLGEASYALYLLHGPVKTLVEPILMKLGTGSVQTDALACLVNILVAIAVSLLAYKYLEAPARRKIISIYSARDKVRGNASTS
jgi:peptidoglycan/LPS O-acetylase OafA/YrhL